MTKYAEDIYGYILETRSHPTAEQIFLALKQKNPKISQATVYNNLNALVTAGRLIRLSEAGCPDRYDNTSRHDHLICVRCGALSDRTLSDLHPLPSKSRSDAASCPMICACVGCVLPAVPWSAGAPAPPRRICPEFPAFPKAINKKGTADFPQSGTRGGSKQNKEDFYHVSH